MNEIPSPPRQTANPSPVRQPDSIRRTCSIDVSWPEGSKGNRLFQGRARDAFTPHRGGAPEVLAEAAMDARLDEAKTIVSIAAQPAPANLQKLVGERGGGHLRMVLAELMPELIERADPLYLILDDLSGTALVSAFAWSIWSPERAEQFRASMTPEQMEKMQASRTNVCWGLQEGNSGLAPIRKPGSVANADGGELRNPADPEGWHAFPDYEGPGFRRARRIDVSRDAGAGLLRVSASFQDTARQQDGMRIAIHEYDLALTADAETLEILSLEPTPRILPFWECPGAVANTQRLVGRRLDEIRGEVLAQLRGPQGCTHLNDALRALADVPRLASHLRETA